VHNSGRSLNSKELFAKFARRALKQNANRANLENVPELPALPFFLALLYVVKLEAYVFICSS
jgi:hypothetical protein